MQPTSKASFKEIPATNVEQPPTTKVASFDEKSDKTISYLEVADLQPGVVKYRTKICDSLLPKDAKMVLDFGCGLGTFLDILYQSHSAGKYIGVDHNLSVIQYAKNAHSSSPLTFIHDVDGIFFNKNRDKFTTIIIERVLHCLNDKKIVDLLELLVDILEADGKIVIVTPDFESQQIIPKSETSEVILNYGLQHSTINPVSPKKIEQYLKDVGEKYSLNISQEICQIVTSGFQKTNEDLCLNDLVNAAIKDMVIDDNKGKDWIEDLKCNSSNVFGISNMYIFTLHH